MLKPHSLISWGKLTPWTNVARGYCLPHSPFWVSNCMYGGSVNGMLPRKIIVNRTPCEICAYYAHTDQKIVIYLASLMLPSVPKSPIGSINMHTCMHAVRLTDQRHSFSNLKCVNWRVYHICHVKTAAKAITSLFISFIVQGGFTMLRATTWCPS